MKIAVIGNGKVGKAVFRELQGLQGVNELVIAGKNSEACRAEAEDYLDALPMRLDHPPRIKGGGYELTEGADILVYCTGPSVVKEDRMSIAGENVRVAREVFEQVDRYAPEALVICITNPLDVITTAIQKLTGRPPEKVIGTGTLLDTARLRMILALALDVCVEDVQGCVIGEHGSTSVILDSSIRILGRDPLDYVRSEDTGIKPVLGKELADEVRDAGFKIFRGKGYTSSGVAAAAARIVFDIINDTRRVYPVSTVLNGPYGVDGFAVSVPCMIGRGGIVAPKSISMTEREQDAFRHSVETVRQACVDAGLIDG